MMYRSHWGTKDPGQRILAIDIARTDFDTIFEKSVINNHDKNHNLSSNSWKEAVKKVILSFNGIQNEIFI